MKHVLLALALPWLVESATPVEHIEAEGEDRCASGGVGDDGVRGTNIVIDETLGQDAPAVTWEKKDLVEADAYAKKESVDLNVDFKWLSDELKKIVKDADKNGDGKATFKELQDKGHGHKDEL